MIAFGPVPSRRLGRSLGVNNIPPKVCSYSCVYCQVGRTRTMRVARGTFHDPGEVLRAVEDKIERARLAGEAIAYLSFVPDGEPTLDENLGREIKLLKPLGIKVAVISNGSLIWREDVRDDLAQADWVSLKIDSVSEEPWRRINRPHGSLHLNSILDGMWAFAEDFSGTLATETMLVDGINDGEATIRELAGFLATLQPRAAYLSIPTRPPAENWVGPPSEAAINRAFQILSGAVGQVEYLIGYEGNAFAFTGNVAEDLLSITAVHPMRSDGVEELLRRAGADWAVVHRLAAQGQLARTMYGGREFYVRKLPGPRHASGHRAGPGE